MINHEHIRIKCGCGWEGCGICANGVCPQCKHQLPSTSTCLPWRYLTEAAGTSSNKDEYTVWYERNETGDRDYTLCLDKPITIRYDYSGLLEDIV